MYAKIMLDSSRPEGLKRGLKVPRNFRACQAGSHNTSAATQKKMLNRFFNIMMLIKLWD